MPETAKSFAGKLRAFPKLLIKSLVPWSRAAAWRLPTQGRGRLGTGLRQPPACPPAHTPATMLSPRLAVECPVSPPRSCVLLRLKISAWSVPSGCSILSWAGAGFCSSPPRGPLQWRGPCPDPAPHGFANETGVFAGWLGDCMGRRDKSHACFSPDGSTVTHTAAPLSHGFVSGCTQRGAGAQEAIHLYEKVS